jgi:hypothetical protein
MGFSSPDSDYDCRFVFVRRAVDHITPWTARDVIELPLEGDLDANGWDLRKALRLLLKGNAVIVEWLRSPVIYRGQAWFRDGFLAFAQRATSREAIGCSRLQVEATHPKVWSAASLNCGFGDRSRSSVANESALLTSTPTSITIRLARQCAAKVAL